MIRAKSNRTGLAAFSAMALAVVLLALTAQEARAQDTPSVTRAGISIVGGSSATTNRRNIFVFFEFNRAFDPLDPAIDDGLDFSRVLDANGSDVTEHFTASDSNRLILGPNQLGFEILAGDGLEGEYRIMIRGSSFTFGGVPIADFVTDSFTIDTIVPTLTRVARQDPMRQFIFTNDTELTFRLTFSEIVAGLDANDFNVTGPAATVSGIVPVGGVSLPGFVAGTMFSATWDVTITISRIDLAILAEGTRVGLVPVVTPGFLGIGIGDRYNNNLSSMLPAGDDYEIWIRGQTEPDVAGITRLSPTAELTNSRELRWQVAYNFDISQGTPVTFADNWRLFFTDLDGNPITPDNPPTVTGVFGLNPMMVVAGGGSLGDGTFNGKIGVNLSPDHQITRLDTSARIRPPDPDNIETFTVDNVHPRLTLDSRAPAGFTDGDFRVTLVFSEPMGSLGYSVENGQVSSETVDPLRTTWTLLIRTNTPDYTAREDIKIRFDEITTHDLAGNRLRLFTLTIPYNEPMITLTLTPTSIREDGGSVTLSATLEPVPMYITSAPPFLDETEITVTLTPVGGAMMSDYRLSRNTLSFPRDGVGRLTVENPLSIGIVNNDVVNSNRVINIEATAAVGDRPVAITNELPLTLTIVNDDVRGVDVSETEVTVAEDGGAADYAVALETVPTGEVTVTVASDAETAATVSPNALMFTSANWDTPQTVTVTGVNDDVDSADRSATIRHAASGADYAGVSASVSVTVTDDDDRGVDVSETGVTVAEDGGMATYTVALESEPTANVTIDVASDTETAATVSPNILTFTPANWDMTQTVRVTGVNDDVDSDRTTTIRHTASGADYAGESASVPVTVTDDDERGVDVSDAGVTVAEDGGTADYTVVLESEPTANVTIGVASDDVDAATVSPNALVFTPANWNVPQPVTVTGVNDNVDSPDRTATINHTASGADYAGESASVPVTVTDDDERGVTVSGSAAGVTVAEDGGMADYTVALESEPTANVTIDVASDNMTAATVSPNALIFTPANWNVPQPVTVTGVNDDVDSANRSAIIRHTASGADYGGVSVASVSVTVTDDDDRGVDVSAAGTGVTVAEDGGMATYTVALASQPTANVTIDVASDNMTAATVSPNALMFTPANWNVPQPVTVTGVNDDVDSANRSAIISHTASGADYGGVSVAGVTVTVTDDDDRGVTVSGSAAGVTVAEDGGTADYTVVLASQPTGEVSITVASDDVDAATVSPDTLMFTSANWNVPQPVTVTGVNDNVDSANRSAIISHTASGADYGGVSVAGVTVTVTDDDDRGVTVSGADAGVTVAEDGGTADYTVVLASQPTGEVSITVASDNMAAATVSPDTLMFTSANWDMTQTVTVTGVNDDTDGDRTATISHMVSGADYGGVSAASVAVTVSDDDPTPITASIAAGNTPTEAGPVAGTFTVTLIPAVPAGASARIAYDVSGTATSGTDYTITASPLTIDANGTTGTITVTPVDDDLDDDAETVVVTLTGVTLMGADDYAGMVDGANTSATLTITDDDATPITASIAAGDTPTEAGPVAGTFTVTLTPAVPTGASASIAYDVSGTATQGTDYTITASPLTIDANGTTGTITVTPVDDDLDDDAETVIVTLTGVTLMGADDYAGMVDGANTSATLTITDDDATPITASIAADATTPTEAGPVAGTFTVTLTPAVPTGASASIVYEVSGTATDGTDYTITASPLTIAAGGTMGTITVTPMDDGLDDDAETVVVTLTGAALTPADGYTAAVDGANASATLTIAEDLRRMERRDRGISMALSTVGWIVGWDTTDSIRRRLGSGGESGAPRLSGFPHSGLSPDSEPELTDFQDLLRDGVGVDVALNARSGGGAAAGEVPLVQAWATASRSDFDNEPFAGRIQDGEGAVTRIGVDALYDSGWKVGVTVGKHNIEVDFDDRAVNTTGAQDFDLMVLNPYFSYSRDRRLVWGTVGIGNGDMNYREHSEGRIRRGSADLRLRGISGGFEYGLVTTGPLDLTGRGEAMAVRIDADESGASEVQFASRTDVYGARGEMEIGLSAITRGGLRVRPYALVGFRWDGGDLEDAVAAEYGGGIDVRGESFFVEAAARSQLDSDDENVHLTAWGLSFGYDRDGDHRGLILDFSQNSGPSRYDPFDDGAGGVLPASAPAATAPLTATVRYGLGFRNGLLAPYHTRRYDGSAISSAETGIEYRVGVASWGLMHVYKPATDPDSGDSHSVNLTGRVNF